MTTKDDTERQSLIHPDPKIAAAGRWVPVSEGLPDRTDGFEVTILAQCGTRSIRNSMFVVEKQVWYNVMPDSETVIAWREKPQPFQENL